MNTIKVSTDVAKLASLFSKSLYSDSYAFITEICQNAVDSHRMSKQTLPVKVGIRLINNSNGPNTYEFYVRDYGLSFTSKEDFEDKVLTIANSGKTSVKTEDEDCPMGQYGIGSISPCAYNNKWKYKVITDDQRSFECHIEDVETIGIKYEFSDYFWTGEMKGVEFSIEIKAWCSAFLEKVLEKCAYFKDIQFELDASVINDYPKYISLNMDFQLFETDDMILSTLSTSKEMHIVLDQYSYPIKWNSIGLSPIQCNIGLKFKMGQGLVPDTTRENLKIDENYKSIIMDRIRKVSTYLVDRFNTQRPDEFTSYREVKEAFSQEPIVKINDKFSFPLTSSGLANISSKIKPIKLKDVDDRIIRLFINQYGSNEKSIFPEVFRISRSGSKITKPRGYFPEHYSFFTDGSKISSKKLDYLKSEYTSSKVYTFPKISLKDMRSTCRLISKERLKDIYNLSGVNVWRQEINSFNKILEYVSKEYFKSLENLEVPSDFNTKVRVVNRREKVDFEELTGEIGIQYASRMGNTYAVFQPRDVDISTLKGHNMCFYGTADDKYHLSQLYQCIRPYTKPNYSVAIITATDQKVIKKLNLQNFMNISEFLEGKHEVVRQIVTSYQISKFTNDSFAYSYSEDIQKISQKMYDDLQFLGDYTNTHRGYGSDTFMTNMIKLADELSLYDDNAMEILNNVSKDIDKFDFLPLLPTAYDNKIKEKRLNLINEIFENRKKSMTWHSQQYL